jgi:hypothetical protein
MRGGQGDPDRLTLLHAHAEGPRGSSGVGGNSPQARLSSLIEISRDGVKTVLAATLRCSYPDSANAPQPEIYAEPDDVREWRERRYPS